MNALQPYLNFPGTTEEAFTFYKSVFGGEFTAFQRFKDTAACDQMPPDALDKIMHVALPIGPSTVLMATDAIPSMGQTCTPGTNFSLSIDAESEEEADRLFSSLSLDGTVQMAMAKTFWGSYFGMFTDKFGIKWLVVYTYPSPQ